MGLSEAYTKKTPLLCPMHTSVLEILWTLSGIKQHLWYSTFCFYYNNIVLNIMAYVALIFFSLVSFHGFWLAGDIEPFLSNKFHIPNYRKRPFGVALSLVTLICIIVIWLFKGELLGSYFHMELSFFFLVIPFDFAVSLAQGGSKSINSQ